MKKTLTVNLGGTVFNIDEDAFQLLEKYLANLKVHFSREDGTDEILSDFELRISEILSDKIRAGYNVITIDDVEAVIKRMGKVEDLCENDFRDDDSKKTQSSAGSQQQPRGERIGRRLFRNEDDKMLGGVCSGLAAYMGWDPTPVRLLAFVLIFVWAVSIPIYIVLWMLVPPARTATEKLQMRGENVTVENIGKTVTDGFEKLSSKMNEFAKSEKSRSSMQRFADVVVELIGIALKCIGILIGVALLPALIVIVVSLFFAFLGLMIGAISGSFGLLSHLMPSLDWSHLGNNSLWGLTLLAIFGILLVGIPLAGLLHGILSAIFKWKPWSEATKWAMLILWFIALVFGIIIAAHYGYIWEQWGWRFWRYMY
ncbi:MAG: PspC domain-containing protein [Tannerellaceae bacterium]|jgi:phage shock protein PspC (stress-responsive transcriptional regulator)|nr:PspC domain-containing protein [Tannerellaceae bacterium]